MTQEKSKQAAVPIITVFKKVEQNHSDDILFSSKCSQTKQESRRLLNLQVHPHILKQLSPESRNKTVKQWLKGEMLIIVRFIRAWNILLLKIQH